MDGMEGKVEMMNKRRVNSRELFLRFSAFLFTLVSVILIGLNKQSKLIPIKILANFPPVDVLVTAKWKYQSAFVYHMVATLIACSYAAVSLFVLIANKGGGKRGLASIIVILDLVMVALLFSSSSAAGAIGVLGYTGNSHVQWQKVCNVFGKFCEQAAAAVGLSLFGGLALLLLVALQALGAHNIPN
ncbi:hypothetical protein Pint_25047 [Pistacia integerrima]|uniref:Uncharacterized protein n=1 Tax=Pistacia integerrima TaxID=434235 RepID=A0ACC0YFT5_9ROSI|nr:hypothetical protein Pint_25047 [Pistacia integerrima]